MSEPVDFSQLSHFQKELPIALPLPFYKPERALFAITAHIRPSDPGKQARQGLLFSIIEISQRPGRDIQKVRAVSVFQYGQFGQPGQRRNVTQAIQIHKVAPGAARVDRRQFHQADVHWRGEWYSLEIHRRFQQRVMLIDKADVRAEQACEQLTVPFRRDDKVAAGAQRTPQGLPLGAFQAMLRGEPIQVGG